MKINELEVAGLNESSHPINIKFNDDINIITGRNGSGKTTILKLMWYCISANIERALREIHFTNVKIVTSKYTLQVERSKSKNRELVRFIISKPTGEILFDKKEPINRGETVEEANEITVGMLDTSIFFPTFRRIEGGFSMDEDVGSRARRVFRSGSEFVIGESEGFGSQIQEALESHADRLSVGNHKFVSSISTVDISQLVTRKHSDATTKVNDYSKSLSEKIFTEIRSYRQLGSKEKDALKDAVSTLDKINQDVVELELVRENAFKSLSVLSNIIVTIFKHKGIRLNPRVTLGDIDQSINSDSLSAGEKQMLSFLCYNALYNDCPFFIDEPELSLHVDWQRILLDVMIEQKTNNQLFIATHSPFIYTQYEDKEIMIGTDRGDLNGG